MSEMWTGGCASSSALIELAAGRGLPPDTSVTSDLVELVQRHGLSALLSRQSNAPLARAVYSRLHARREVMLNHLSRILVRLDGAGIRAAVLKGAHVARHYRDPAVRTYGDLDLLVEESSLQAALEVLGSDEAAAGIPERRAEADKRDIFFRDPSGIVFNVDLHWDLFAYSQLRGVASGATAEAWRTASPVRDSLIGPYWALPEATEICFLATHAVLDHRFRLILFRDFAEIAQRRVAWEELVDTAGRWGLRALAYVPLWLARHAIGAAIPPDVLDALRVRSLILSYLEHALPKLDLVRFDGHNMHPVNLAAVLLADSPGHRLALAARVPNAFPSWRRRVSSERSSAAAPRVLIVASTDQRRGAEVFAERLCEGLMELGWVVDAVSLTTVGNDTARVAVNPLTDFRPDETGRLEPRLVSALRERIKSLNADIVFAIGPTLRYGVLANFGLRSRVVYLGIGEPDYWLRSRRSALLNAMLLRRVDKVLAVSERTKAQLIALEPKIADKVEVTYTGVPDALFLVKNSRPGGPLHVVMIGSLSDEKDPELALQAVAKVEGAKLRFVGDGPMGEQLRQKARELGVLDRMEFVGSVDDVTPHMRWADVLVLTSKTEGLPGVILEAGAAGIPSVSVDVGGVREAIQDGVTGLVVAPGDLTALTDALVDLANDPQRLMQMSKAAQAHVKERFGMDVTLCRYTDALSGVT